MQQWFTLSDPAVEEALYDSLSMRAFAGIDLGTIVDATIIEAPSSTKNKARQRDPEMHSTRKGKQWHFGMKAHIGVDSTSKVVHSLVTTSANVHDSNVLLDLLHGNDTRVWGDSAYARQGDVIQAKAPRALDFTIKRAYRNRPLTEAQEDANSHKSRTRCRVERVHNHGADLGEGWRRILTPSRSALVTMRVVSTLR